MWRNTITVGRGIDLIKEADPIGLNSILDLLNNDDILLLRMYRTNGTKDGYAIVDLEDMGIVKECRWFIHQRGVVGEAGGKYRMLSRVIMKSLKSDCIVFKNGNIFDLRRSNLQIANHARRMLSFYTNLPSREGSVWSRRSVSRTGKVTWYWSAHARSGGKRFTKDFSVEKYGEDGARALAEEWRQNIMAGVAVKEVRLRPQEDKEPVCGNFIETHRGGIDDSGQLVAVCEFDYDAIRM